LVKSGIVSSTVAPKAYGAPEYLGSQSFSIKK
jgi:hypothetical protein